jgi:hypothetical protein
MSSIDTFAPASPSGRDRLRGIALCVIGAALAIGMTAAAWLNAPLFLQPGQLIDGDRFTGTLEQGRHALALFLSVALLGLAFAGLGVGLARTGRHDRRLLWFTGIVAAVTLGLLWRMGAML